MNLRARKLGLILVSALAFFSCESDELSTIGLPPENNLGIFFVEIPLENVVTQVWVNDITSRNTGTAMAGSYTDPVLGEISAQNFSELLLPSANPGRLLEEDAVLDSLVLEMRIGNAFGVDLTSTTQTIQLYQLQDTIRSFEQSYYNESNQAVGMQLAEESFLIYTDSLDLLFSDTNLPDTAAERKRYDNQGRYIYKTNFHLDDAFAQNFFTEMKDTTENSTFSSNQNFANFIKGFRLNGVPGNSAVIAYNPTSSFSALVLYYTQTEEGVPVHKTIRFTYNTAISYNNITPNADVNWSGGDLDGLTSFYQPYESGTSAGYLQAGTHLFLKLDMSFFNAFADTVENPIIQNAELVMESPREYPGDGVRLPLPIQLNATVTSLDSLETGNISSNQDVASDLPKIAEYDEEEQRYKIEIPVYLQTLVNNSNVYDQLIFSPLTTDPFTGSLKSDNASFNRLVIEKENIKIRLYYTLPNAN